MIGASPLVSTISATWPQFKNNFWLRCYFCRGSDAKYCDEFVCMTVCMLVRSHVLKTARPNFAKFFSERTTLRSLYAISRPSVVCLSVVCLSVTLVHPTQAVELFGNFFHHMIAQGLYFSGAKNRWWGTPLSPWNFCSKWPTPLSNSKISTNIGS